MNYLKQGNLEVTDKDKDLFLRNKDGKLFNVPPIVAFVWEQLDGDMNLEQVEDAIKAKVGNLYHEENNQVAEKIINELLKVELVKPIQ